MKIKYPDSFDGLCVVSATAFNHLPITTQVANCIHMLESEVNNGGFHQFFSNSSGLFVLQTLDALSTIKAYKAKELLSIAIKIAYTNGYPLDAENHNVELLESNEVLNLLEKKDQKFYDYEDNLTSLVNNYLKINTQM